MPMPEFSGKFPGAPWDVAADAYHIFNSWYSGDVDALEEIYAHQHSQAPASRPSQWRGGVVGALSRMWFGKPLTQDQKRLHIPAAAGIATTSADLLFGQPPSWLFSEGDAADLEGAQARLSELLDGADTLTTFLKAAEIQASLGGVYLRLTWDQAVAKKIMMDAVAPDAAIPQWRYGRLTAVTFWTFVGKDKRGTWRHLEHHEPGRIEHALYCGDDGSIGRKMGLGDRPETTWAAELVDDQSSIATNIDRLTACYIPNVQPARRWRNIPQLSPLGRSDFEGIEPLFDALDEAWSSWMRDLELAKARLFVSQEALEDQGPGLGATFDPEQQIFTGVPDDGGTAYDAAAGIRQLVQAQQFEIRVKEHAETCERLLKEILRAAGYSAGDFDDGDAAAITATEVSARKDKSNLTRAKKILLWQAEASELAFTAMLLDAKVNGGSDFGITKAPEMKFPVRADQDPVQLSTAISNLRLAKAISTPESVRMFHPNWSNDEVDDEVALIEKEAKAEAEAQQPVMLDTPGDFVGGKPAAEDPAEDDPFAKAA